MSEPDSLDGRLLESLPDGVVASLEVRDAWRKRVAEASAGLEFIVSDLLRWVPGSTVRVAFLDGDDALHADIAEATQADHRRAATSTLDFGDDAAGTYRRWTEADTEHAGRDPGQLRPGRLLVAGRHRQHGRDDRPRGEPIGGRPGPAQPEPRRLQDRSKPQGWEGTVRHEFLHALGVPARAPEHARAVRGRLPLGRRPRLRSDAGTPAGVFVQDAAGRAPGIYTYLAGAPNSWSKAKVDHNLRTEDDPGHRGRARSIAASVMLYRFAPFFYKTSRARARPPPRESTSRKATSAACACCTRRRPETWRASPRVPRPPWPS